MSSRVLIADDDRDARVLWSAVAEAENLTVVEAEDGREAMDALNENPDFALVITDVMMPLADGYEVLKFIREDERLKHLPVIVSTSDRTTRGLTGIPVDDRTFFINKASGLDSMRRGIMSALGR
ncbi:MAG: PleD family two-component system response regulator [Blastocatellales bacterium]